MMIIVKDNKWLYKFMIKVLIILCVLFCGEANAKSRSHSHHKAAQHRFKSFQHSNKARSYDRKYKEDHKLHDWSQRNKYNRKAREENSKAIKEMNR